MAVGPHVVTCSESVSNFGCGLPADTFSPSPQLLVISNTCGNGLAWGEIKVVFTRCFGPPPVPSTQRGFKFPRLSVCHHCAFEAPSFGWQVPPRLKWHGPFLPCLLPTRRAGLPLSHPLWLPLNSKPNSSKGRHRLPQFLASTWSPYFLSPYVLPDLGHVWASADVGVTLAVPFAGLDG